MSFNFGNNYSMFPMMPMGMNYPMIGGPSSGNIPQHFKYKYGCEDCFRKDTYSRGLPEPMIQEQYLKNSPIKQFFKTLLCL